jgi:flavin reductase (DIM6/NTAB) family NADH-FMN oxidoreductase RutF
MFYDPLKKDHGLPHTPLNALVAPRPIGWITTLSRDGVVNLAPFSYFNLVSGDPPVVMFACSPRPDNRRKDSQVNAEQTGEFVFNLATWDLREQMNLTASIEEPDFDELQAAGLTPARSELVRPPRVAESPVHFECRYLQTVDMPPSAAGHYASVVIGQVIGIHIDDSVIVDGIVDVAKMRPIARLGYNDYVVVTELFTMPRLNAQQLQELGLLKPGAPEPEGLV